MSIHSISLILLFVAIVGAGDAFAQQDSSQELVKKSQNTDDIIKEIQDTTETIKIETGKIKDITENIMTPIKTIKDFQECTECAQKQQKSDTEQHFYLGYVVAGFGALSSVLGFLAYSKKFDGLDDLRGFIEKMKGGGNDSEQVVPREMTYEEIENIKKSTTIGELARIRDILEKVQEDIKSLQDNTQNDLTQDELNRLRNDIDIMRNQINTTFHSRF